MSQLVKAASSVSQKWVCQGCGNVFDDLQTILRHVPGGEEIVEKWFCSYCGSDFPGLERVLKHVDEKHLDMVSGGDVFGGGMT